MAKKTNAKSKANKNKNLKRLNETGVRKQTERRIGEAAVTSERRKGHRRRQIDPTTCEREYSDPEIEFMHALDEYKRLSGRMFPTCSEILEVLHKMGYRLVADPQVVYDPEAEPEQSDEDTIDSEETFV